MNSLDVPIWKLAAAAEAAAKRAGDQAKSAGIAVAGIVRAEGPDVELRTPNKRQSAEAPKPGGAKERSPVKKHAGS